MTTPRRAPEEPQIWAADTDCPRCVARGTQPPGSFEGYADEHTSLPCTVCGFQIPRTMSATAFERLRTAGGS